MEDLKRTLDSIAAKRRKDDLLLAEQTGPRIPTLADTFARTNWRPPPSKEDIKQSLTGNVGSRFVSTTKNRGLAFEAQPPRLKPKVLDPWTASRVNMPDRSIRVPKGSAPWRMQYQSEPLPEPTDDMCHRMHRLWLTKHAVERDKYVNEVTFALERLDKAKSIQHEHMRRRQITRDMLTRGQLNPTTFGDPKALNRLGKVKMAVKMSHAFHSAAGLNVMKDEEEKDERRVQMAMSDPALRLRPPSPHGQVNHLRRWGDPNATGRLLKESTPWRERDEEREITLRRMAATAA